MHRAAPDTSGDCEATPSAPRDGAPPIPPEPLVADASSLWMLDPEIDFLNHGSFGALPRSVSARQEEWRRRVEARPIEMLGRRCRELLGPAREAVAGLVGASPADIGFVTNATGGINAVLRALPLRAGDVLATTTHVYNAVRQTMRFVARQAGAEYRELPVPPPFAHPDAIVDAIDAALDERVRLLVVDHISSPTAVVFPVERIVARCRERGIDVLIDGAHAPGMVPLELERLGAAYYAANLHKWMCAPKGCAFLWTRRDRQAHVHPATISHFLDQGYATEFDWQGTRDISAWICAADAIAFMRGLGLERVMAHNHALATWVQAHLCGRWGVQPLTPLDGSLLGSMATVRLPSAFQPGGPFATFESINLALYERFRIEVPVVEWQGVRHVRPCCQVYNRPEQYERLADAVLALARSGADAARS
ncbi:MAG: aminotransferase class V-fold PLP-dependent enzyme [Phycisphaerales bacterium]|nr:aminotransferase class V-fold PLP-dependent enzyme [Phycisphaerales bacterium]